MGAMIERVARALAENRRIRRAASEHEACACMGPAGYCYCEHQRDLADARAAIAAMREPTEEMEKAAEPVMQDLGWACREQSGPFPAQADIFRSMIDAALRRKA